MVKGYTRGMYRMKVENPEGIRIKKIIKQIAS